MFDKSTKLTSAVPESTTSTKKMRICIARSHKNTLTQTFIRNQIKALSERAEVFPIYSGRLPQRSENGQLLSSYPFFLIHKVYKWISGNRSNYFGTYGIIKFLRKNRIEVVLANFGMTAAHLVPACEKAKVPLVPVFHGMDASVHRVLREYKQHYARLFEYSTAIIVVSKDMKESLIGLGAQGKKISVIPCSIDVDLFVPNYSLREKNTVFLSTGRLTKKKSPMSTIRAFAKVNSRHPGARLIMVGEKSGLYQECADLVAELGITDAVEFPGSKTQNEIVTLMQQAHVFVQHSVVADDGNMEGTPVSIMEAGASGMAVVSTLHGGIKDAVIHGKTGFLVEEHDVDAMADYMMQLIEDPDLAIAMGKEGREHIAENYNLETQTDKMLHLLQTVANSGK
jgi:colanic acid/amylovoran biosynthesis glycosyltransferase